MQSIQVHKPNGYPSAFPLELRPWQVLWILALKLLSNGTVRVSIVAEIKDLGLPFVREQGA